MRYADENLVGRVLNNLLKNAVEAIGEHDGWVEVCAFLNERAEDTPAHHLYYDVRRVNRRI